jgi:hypothetical protein
MAAAGDTRFARFFLLLDSTAPSFALMAIHNTRATRGDILGGSSFIVLLFKQKKGPQSNVACRVLVRNGPHEPRRA